MDELKRYFELQSQIYEYFGFTEGEFILPLEDNTRYFWHLIEEGDGGTVFFADEASEIGALIEGDDGDYYQSSLYTQSRLPACIYRGKDFTMFVLDPHENDNHFLGIFDNSKVLKRVGRLRREPLSGMEPR